MNELAIKEDILSLSEMKQSEVNVVLAQMTSLTNAIVSGRDDIDSMVTSLEKQPWYKRMWNTLTGKNKATKEEIALKKDQMSQYTVQAISNLYEMGKIHQDIIVNLGQKINDIYYQTTRNNFEQLMIKDSIIKLRSMVCDIAVKLNDKIEKIDISFMLTKEIEQGKYNDNNPIVAICGVTSNLNNSLLNDSRKMDIIKTDISQHNLFDDVEKTLTEFMNDVTTIPDDKAGMVYLELASMHDNIWASMFSELMESYNMLPKMERMAKKKDVIINDILEKKRMDENATFSSEDLFREILGYKTELASMTEKISYNEPAMLKNNSSDELTETEQEELAAPLNDNKGSFDDEYNKYMSSLPAEHIMIDRNCVERDYFNDEKNNTVISLLSASSQKVIAIPYGTKRIGTAAFSKTDIMRIIIPDTVEEIDENAFRECNYLNNVVLPDSVKIIGNRAFLSCSCMEFIELNNGLIEIGISAFALSGIRKITLPEGVKNIGDSAFGSCRKLEEVKLNTDLVKIGYSVFSGCDVLRSCSSSQPGKSSLNNIGKCAFQSCPELKIISDIDNVKEIGDEAFYSAGFEEISLPAGLKKIGCGAFKGCENLKRVRFGESEKPSEEIIEIGEKAFSFCKSLNEIALPKNLRILNEETFGFTYQLKSITLNEGLTEIKKDVFKSSAVEELTLPSSLKKLAPNALVCGYGRGIKKINVPKSIYQRCESWGLASRYSIELFDDKRSDSNANDSIDINEFNKYMSSLPEKYTMLDRECVEKDYPSKFSKSVHWYNDPEASALGKLVDRLGLLFLTIQPLIIPYGTKRIGKFAFEIIEIGKIILPDTVEIIDESAFSSCSELREVNFPVNLKEIGVNAFKGCKRLQSVTLNEGLVKIGMNAFECTTIEKITLPKSLKIIEKGIFNGCWNLKKVRVPQGLYQEVVSLKLVSSDKIELYD